MSQNPRFFGALLFSLSVFKKQNSPPQPHLCYQRVVGSLPSLSPGLTFREDDVRQGGGWNARRVGDSGWSIWGEGCQPLRRPHAAAEDAKAARDHPPKCHPLGPLWWPVSPAWVGGDGGCPWQGPRSWSPSPAAPGVAGNRLDALRARAVPAQRCLIKAAEKRCAAVAQGRCLSWRISTDSETSFPNMEVVVFTGRDAKIKKKNCTDCTVPKEARKAPHCHFLQGTESDSCFIEASWKVYFLAEISFFLFNIWNPWDRPSPCYFWGNMQPLCSFTSTFCSLKRPLDTSRCIAQYLIILRSK